MHPPPKDKDAKCYKNPVSKGHFAIKTSDLETELKKYLLEIKQVTFVKDKITQKNYSEVLNSFDIIISATGGRDPFPELIGNKYTEKHLSNGMTFTFTIKNNKTYKTSSIEKKVDNYAMQQRFRGFRTDHSTFYLGVQLGNSEIAKITEDSFEKLPASIKSTFHNALMKYEVEHLIDYSTIEISHFPITKRTASIAAGKYLNTQIYLVGDSVSTTHFFSGQGVNVGIESAIFLSTLLSSKQNSDEVMAQYNEKCKELSNKLTVMSNNVTVDMDELDKRCKKYTKAEIYDLAKQHNLIVENMSKREVCLSLLHIIKE